MIKTPGGQLRYLHIKKKGTPPKCGDCGIKLPGVSATFLFFICDEYLEIGWDKTADMDTRKSTSTTIFAERATNGYVCGIGFGIGIEHFATNLCGRVPVRHTRWISFGGNRLGWDYTENCLWRGTADGIRTTANITFYLDPGSSSSRILSNLSTKEDGSACLWRIKMCQLRSRSHCTSIFD